MKKKNKVIYRITKVPTGKVSSNFFTVAETSDLRECVVRLGPHVFKGLRLIVGESFKFYIEIEESDTSIVDFFKDVAFKHKGSNVLWAEVDGRARDEEKGILYVKLKEIPEEDVSLYSQDKFYEFEVLKVSNLIKEEHEAK